MKSRFRAALLLMAAALKGFAAAVNAVLSFAAAFLEAFPRQACAREVGAS